MTTRQKVWLGCSAPTWLRLWGSPSHIREARFKRNSNGTPDGEVHALFVVSGRRDAVGCNIDQPTFVPAGNPLTGQGGNPNIIFRIPTPAVVVANQGRGDDLYHAG